MTRDDNNPTRRDFVATTAAGAALAATPLALARSAHAQGKDVVRCGVVGCGPAPPVLALREQLPPASDVAPSLPALITALDAVEARR